MENGFANQRFSFFPRWVVRKRMVAAYVALLHRKRQNIAHTIPRLPNRTPLQTGEQWFLRLIERPNDFHDEFRMSVPCFWKLHTALRKYYGLRGMGNMHTYEALATFLSLCGHSTTQRRLGRVYEHSTSTINITCHDVLKSICLMAVDIIEPRDRSFSSVSIYVTSKAPEFHDAIGALDGTHIPAIVSEDVKPDYIGRKGSPTQNVLVVVDFDMMFTHVFAGVPGSQHDAAILRYALAAESASFPQPPAGKYYLVDSGYANATGYLAPFRNTPYYPFEFTRAPNRMEEVFNQSHASMRNVVERSIGVWKKKWVILQHMREYPFVTQLKFVHATAALHNFIRENDANDIDIESSRLGSYTRHDEDPDEPLPEEEHHEDTQSMAAMRNTIAQRLVMRTQRGCGVP